MTESASLRFGIEAAPLGLCFVQELVNTASTNPTPKRTPDLLATTEAAHSWLTSALDQWAATTGQSRTEIALIDRDLAPLRELREAIRSSILSAGAASATVAFRPVSVTVRPYGGRLGYEPAGSGAVAVESLVAMEVLLAQQSGVWRRFRACSGDGCGAAFYDESRSGTRVWHDVRTCGNRHNLRVSRARSRAAD